MVGASFELGSDGHKLVSCGPLLRMAIRVFFSFTLLEYAFTITAVCEKVGTTRFGNKQTHQNPILEFGSSLAHPPVTGPFIIIGSV